MKPTKLNVKNMKTLKLVSFVLIAAVAFSVFLTSCESNPDVNPQQDILPQTLSVDIPASLSYTSTSGGRIGGRSKADSINGNHVYLQLGTFIAVGEGASQIVEGIIHGLRKHRIDRVGVVWLEHTRGHRQDTEHADEYQGDDARFETLEASP